MSATTLPSGFRRNRRRSDPVGLAVEIVACLAILIWTLTPLYSMVTVALEHKEDVFGSAIWPVHPTLAGFWTVLTEGYW